MANAGSFKKGEKRPNQGKRGPGKATKDVRSAIAAIAQGNVEKCQAWLDSVAADDPAKALDLFLKLLEYDIPKLARSEHTGKDGGPVIVQATERDANL